MYARRQLQFTKSSDAGLNAVWTYYGGEKRSKYYMETYIIFGDPLTRMRNDIPRPLRVQGPSQVYVGTRDLDYRIVTEKGKAVRGARVALVSPDGSYSISGLTDNNGSVSFHLSLEVDGPADWILSVSGDNLQLWQGTLKFHR